MNLSNQELNLVQASINDILPIAQRTGELFYEQLFSIAPQLRPLFKDNLKPQARKIMTVLIHIVANLDNMDEIQTELTELAERHLSYQVEPIHYQYIGEALMQTLAIKLEAKWTTELAQAWQSAYNNISTIMLKVHT